jgi:protein-tyrosine phosphatase
MTISVLFVCLGNICRSPMAEATFRKLVDDAGLTHRFEIDSAGTGPWHVGDRPHRGTQAVLRKHGVSTAGMIARQVQPHDLHRFDYLVVMDAGNERDMERLARRYGGGEIIRLLDLADPAVTRGVRDVPDPYYSGGFDYVYELVRSGCQGLLAHILDA